MKKFFSLLLFSLSLFLMPSIALAEGPIKIVASFSIIGDMIKEIGGDFVQLTVLVEPDSDIHSFQPKPEHAKALADANIIAINGLGLEGWMDRIIKASGTKAKLLVASAGIKPIIINEGGMPLADPHAWQNLSNGRIYVRNIANALMSALPEHSPEIRKRALAYDKKLKELDEWVKKQLAEIPAEKRKIIITHDAFRYFGEAYGLVFISPLGSGTDSEPSAYDLARIISQAKDEGIKAVFFENMTNPKLVEQIARDSGNIVTGILYSDALSSPHGPAPTYIDMFRFNVSQISKALR